MPREQVVQTMLKALLPNPSQVGKCAEEADVPKAERAHAVCAEGLKRQAKQSTLAKLELASESRS